MNNVKIKLTNYDLQRIYDLSLDKWKQECDLAVPSHIWPLVCYLRTLENSQAVNGCLSFELPVRLPYQSIEEDDTSFLQTKPSES